jgi:hypothetical protein
MLTGIKPSQTTVLLTVPSASNPAKSHEVKLGKDGNVYCSCPAWRFQKVHPHARTCKHIKAAQAQGLLPADG